MTATRQTRTKHQPQAPATSGTGSDRSLSRVAAPASRYR